jgi:hypothetical protein
MDYETLVCEVRIVPKGKAIFEDTAVIIRREDHAAGEFITISGPEGETFVPIDRLEWPVVRNAIDKMVGELRE